MSHEVWWVTKDQSVRNIKQKTTEPCYTKLKKEPIRNMTKTCKKPMKNM